MLQRTRFGIAQLSMFDAEQAQETGPYEVANAMTYFLKAVSNRHKEN